MKKVLILESVLLCCLYFCKDDFVLKMMVMFRKIIYVFLGFFATVFALNVETGFNDGIMNVTLYEVEGLAQGECGDNGFTECPDRGSTLISCVIKDPVTHETAPGEMDFCMSEGRGCAITPCYNKL